MAFLIGVVLVVAVVIGWMLSRPGGKGTTSSEVAGTAWQHSTPAPSARLAPALYDSMQELPVDLREVVLRVEQTPWDTHDTKKQALRDQLKDAEYDLRNKHRLRWNGENCGPMPIKSMTHHQRRVLSYAATLHAIQIEREETIELNRNVFSGLKRTVHSLHKHGMLRLDEHGVYRITPLGLQALETLSVRFD